MDLSVQKMQPPASVQGKSAAKKNPNSTLVEDVTEDQNLHFKHGNTGYEATDEDGQSQNKQNEQDQRHQRRKQRQLVSNEDLSELTKAAADPIPSMSAAALMNLRAYQHPDETMADEDDPHFDKKL